MRSLLRIGNRIINLDAITQVAYDPSAYHPGSKESYTECRILFGHDNEQIFYGVEADLAWTVIKAQAKCFSTGVQLEAKKDEELIYG